MMDMIYIMDMIDFGFDWMTVIWIIAIASVALTVYFLIAGRKSGSQRILSEDGTNEAFKKKYDMGAMAEEQLDNLKKDILN